MRRTLFIRRASLWGRINFDRAEFAASSMALVGHKATQLSGNDEILWKRWFVVHVVESESEVNVNSRKIGPVENKCPFASWPEIEWTMNFCPWKHTVWTLKASEPVLVPVLFETSYLTQWPITCPGLTKLLLRMPSPLWERIAILLTGTWVIGCPRMISRFSVINDQYLRSIAENQDFVWFCSVLFSLILL